MVFIGDSERERGKMSVEVMKWAFEQDLPAREKWLLVCLSDGAAPEGFVRPSDEFLAKKTGLSDIEIAISFNALLDLCLIVRTNERINECPVYRMEMI